MNLKNRKLIMILVTIAIIVLILIINHIKSNNYSLNKETIKCIAENSTLVVSETCGHCANQKQILGGYINYFNLIEVPEHPEILEQYNIKGVPAWIINNQTYLGIRTLKELKLLTNC